MERRTNILKCVIAGLAGRFREGWRKGGRKAGRQVGRESLLIYRVAGNVYSLYER